MLNPAIKNVVGGLFLYTGFKVGRKRPPTTFSTTELLKERELEEIKAGGLGKGELQGPYIEEEVDPMPDNEEYKQGETKGTSYSNVNVETNDEPRETSTPREVVDIPAKEYDSPAHAMGLATHKEVFTRVDKVVDEFESSKKQKYIEGLVLVSY
ncbi:hypothetical protein Tco_0676618 [Tanacetum coccineum]